MSRETSPYVVGEYWLDLRRDGKSKAWQITRYSPGSRSDVYRSTRTTDLELAKAAIHAHVDRERAKKPQKAEDAEVAPQLFLYWREHGKTTAKPAVIAGSLRAFIGFLMQDEAGVLVTVSQVTPMLFRRFMRWRMAPHRFSVPWDGKDFAVDSTGVKGESVQRNLDDVRAALNYAANAARIPYAPKVPSVPTEDRSPARDVRVTLEQLGAMVGFAATETRTAGDPIPADRHFGYWLALMIATACRPEAALKFDPRVQWQGDLIDLHPKGAKRTKKRNPVVPTIEPFKPTLTTWRGENAAPVLSRRTQWRTMRRALALPDDVIPKTIRHTIATEMRRRGVPGEQVSGILGHTAMHRTTEVYAKYDPTYLREATAVLTTIFEEVMRHANRWRADHSRTKVGNGRTIVVAQESAKVQYYCGFEDGGR